MLDHLKMAEFWSREAQNANRARKHLARLGKTDEANERLDYERYAQSQMTVHQFKAVAR